MKIFAFSFDDEAEKLLNSLTERLSLPKSEVIRQALKHFSEFNKKDKDSASLKLIVTKYNGVCSKCKTSLPIGSFAYYGKDGEQTILVCMDCIVQNKSDKALVARYMKMRELDKLIKAMRKEAEYYASKLDNLQVYAKFDAVYSSYDELVKLLRDYLNAPFDKEKEKLEEVMRVLEKVNTLSKDVEEFINTRIRFDKRPKKPNV